MAINYFIVGVATGVLLAVLSIMAAIMIFAWAADRRFRSVMEDGE